MLRLNRGLNPKKMAHLPYKKIIRIENVYIKELMELLMAAYQKTDYVDILINESEQTIIVEGPDMVHQVELPLRPLDMSIIPIHKIHMDDELYRLLLKK